jgi:hypothetical protein
MHKVAERSPSGIPQAIRHSQTTMVRTESAPARWALPEGAFDPKSALLSIDFLASGPPCNCQYPDPLTGRYLWKMLTKCPGSWAADGAACGLSHYRWKSLWITM